MTHIYIGCDEIIGRRALYFDRVSALEVAETADGNIKDATLSQWRTESPKGFGFAVAAPAALAGPPGTATPKDYEDGADSDKLGHLSQTDATARLWARSVDQARRLGAKAILMKTGTAFTPTADHRARLSWFAETLLPKSKAAVVWEPRGLWDLEETVPWARKRGLVPVYDPFVETDIPHGHGTAYFVIHGRRGMRNQLDDFDMEELIEMCSSYQRAFLMFRGQKKYRDARLCQTVWDSLKDA